MDYQNRMDYKRCEKTNSDIFSKNNWNLGEYF